MGVGTGVNAEKHERTGGAEFSTSRRGFCRVAEVALKGGPRTRKTNLVLATTSPKAGVSPTFSRNRKSRFFFSLPLRFVLIGFKNPVTDFGYIVSIK